MMPKAIRPNIMNWPNSSPKPMELANQAKPRPAARPPNIAPHGRFCGAAAGGGAAGVAGVAFCVGLEAPCV